MAKPDTPPSSLDPPQGHQPSSGCHILGWGNPAKGSSSCNTALGKGHSSTQQCERPLGVLDGEKMGGVLSPPRASCTPWQPQGTHQDFPSSPGPGRAPVNTAALKPDPHPPTLPADSLGCRISLPPPPTWVVAEGTQLPPAHLGPAGFSSPGTPGCPGHPPAVGTGVRGVCLVPGGETNISAPAIPSPGQAAP